MYYVSFLPILISGIAAAILASIWFHDRVFGRVFPSSGAAPERKRTRVPFMAFWMFFAGIVVAYVLSYFGIAWGVYDWVGALELGIWTWIGFIAPPILSMVLWEGKPFRRYAVTAGYWLVMLVVTALILVFLS